MAEMTHGGAAVVTLPADTQILITRAFSAPRHLVWRAYTTPELVRRWWAGKRGRMITVDMDVRVGGRWRYVMQTNGGHEIAFHGVYREIVPGERMVFTEVFEMPGASEPADDDAVVNTVRLVEDGGRTTMTILSDCPSRAVRDAIIASGMEGGMQEHMDLLEEVARSLA